MKEYRGWTIAPCDAVQLGYRTGEGAKSRFGKGRKMKGYMITYAPDSREKFVSTLKEAREYIDSYMGPVAEEPNAPALRKGDFFVPAGPPSVE